MGSSSMVYKGLSSDELWKKSELAKKSGFDVYWPDAHTVIEYKNEPDIEKTIEPLTFIVSLDKNYARHRTWRITSRQADELIGYTVEVLDPSAPMVSDKYQKGTNGSFAINRQELREIQVALESKSLDKIATVLYKLAGDRAISAMQDKWLQNSPRDLEDIANESRCLQYQASHISKAAEIKLTLDPKPSAPVFKLSL